MLHEIFAMPIRIATVVTTPSRTRSERDGLDWLAKTKIRDDPPSAIDADGDCSQQRSRQHSVDSTSLRECHD